MPHCYRSKHLPSDSWGKRGRCLYFLGLFRSYRPPLWSSGQSSWLLTQRSRIRFPALPHILSSTGYGMGALSLVKINEELLQRKGGAPV
jgi:hypothetical protein